MVQFTHTRIYSSRLLFHTSYCAAGQVDSDPPALVNYRSATRPDSSGDTKRHRQRIKDLRVALTEKGWASIGRFIT